MDLYTQIRNQGCFNPLHPTEKAEAEKETQVQQELNPVAPDDFI